MNITKDVKYLGVTDTEIDLFEGQYTVEDGITYNSYAIIDDKIAIMDSVDSSFGEEWLANIGATLAERNPDYLIVQHMEPDHSACITLFAERYPDAIIVATAKAFAMMKNFFGIDYAERRLVVKEGDTLSLGKHTLSFIAAPMVHWPEVIVTYDQSEKILFSADAFGRFGRADANLPWEDEARRYYIGIVGKYGAQVQALLKKAAGLEIEKICPLHGPVLSENLSRYIGLYDLWSSYRAEKEGVAIAYASIYGNTGAAASLLADELKAHGVEVSLFDLARCDMHAAIAEAFKYSKLVLASATYNGDVFPPMRAYISGLSERGFRSRKVAFIENGSWAPMAAKVMRSSLEECKDISFAEASVKLLSALSEENKAEISALAEELKS